MPWIDGHLDLAYLAVNGRDLTVECKDPREGCLSLPALRQADVEIALATIFTEPGTASASKPHGYASSADLDAAESAGLRQLANYDSLESASHLRIVRCAADLDDCSAPLRAVLLLEGADPIRTPDDLPRWRARGLRAVGLTWHLGTRYAVGNGIRGGLTPLGRDMVHALDHHGLIHDLSHLADEAADELLSIACGPVMASHSNCRSLLGDPANQRHLRDDTIREIGRRDGVIGLNLFTKFLCPNGRATIDDCVRHVEHICDLMGHRRGVGLGSDLDGGFPPTDLPIDLDHPTKLPNLAHALKSAGWTDDDVAGFTHANWRRFLHRALPST